MHLVFSVSDILLPVIVLIFILPVHALLYLLSVLVYSTVCTFEHVGRTISPGMNKMLSDLTLSMVLITN